MRNKCLFFLLACLVVMAPLHAKPVLFANDSCKLYNDCDGNNGTESFSRESRNLKSLIIEAAGAFLGGYALFNEYEMHIELSEIHGLNRAFVNEKLKASIEAISKANAVYTRIIEIADTSSYSSYFESQLMLFNYWDFACIRNVNWDVYNSVVDYLFYSDMTGAYNYIQKQFGTIETKLLNLNIEDIDIKRIHELSQIFAETKLFGQYVAAICKEI